MERGRDISKDDAHKRAVEDYSQFSQYARLCAQYSFIANGGAAAAILSFLTAIINSTAKDHPDPKIIIQKLGVAASLYLFGVFLCLAAMFCLYLAKLYWGHAHERSVVTGYIDFDSDFARRGTLWDRIGGATLAGSLVPFVLGSIFAVLAFLTL